MILITGGNGQLGTELRYLLDELGETYVATDSQDLDITDRQAVMAYVTELKPDYIYHCAAYTAVDKAEDEGKEINYQVNVEGTQNVADAAKVVDATLVYISTDYVFDGLKVDGEYAVDDETNPQNEYGKAKLLGEKAVQNTLEKYYIIRTSWVFGQYGNNFVFTMQRLAKTNKRLTVVNDQYGRPTWTRTLAEFIQYVYNEQVPHGIYHLSNEGSCTWYEFAKEILKDYVELEIVPVTSEEFPQKAKRPQFSVLDLSGTSTVGFSIMNWRESLEKMLKRD